MEKGRRSFTTLAAGSAALAATPAVAQSVTLRCQSAWSANDLFHELATDFARKVNAMSSGRLRIDMLPADAVVKPYDLLDAVSKGVLDGGHGILSLWYGKHPAFSLWGSGPSFGMDPNMLLAWHEHGGGKGLLDEIYRSLNMQVVSMLYAPMPTQPLGLFRRPVLRPDDFKGMRFRAIGPSVDLFTAMGMSISTMSNKEAEAAIERGQLDGATIDNVSVGATDAVSKVAKVCMLRSFHQKFANLELLFNRRRFDALSSEHQAILTVAAQACSAEASWKLIDRCSRDYVELQDRRGVTFVPTPDAILRAQLKAWDEVAAHRSAESQLFRRVSDSMRVFAQRAGHWQNDTLVDYRMAYDHYFTPRKV
ncbi:MAG: TRAP transporter substrate-binding protein [Burkholderiaceae bacterium]